MHFCGGNREGGLADSMKISNAVYARPVWERFRAVSPHGGADESWMPAAALEISADTDEPRWDKKKGDI